jgi:uracil-DNA glycosylase
MDLTTLDIHECWKPIFEKHSDLINEIFTYSESFELPVYPPKDQIFRVFSKDVSTIKVVLLGQDPYHQKGQANGLAFSVNEDLKKIPPSLQNIFKELSNTYPERNYKFNHGNLEKWFYDEHIFLLNTSLSVIESSAGIFIVKWRPFTDDIIKFIDENNKNCVYLLLGKHAEDKMKFIEDKSRCIVGVHPSPLSANRGFIGSKIFMNVEERLGHGIDWSI